MSKLLCSMLLVATTICLNACGDDDDENNGNNNNNSNPCANTNCYNGGYCVEGTCVCPQGYSGTNCQLQITPTKMYITKIIVKRFPTTDNGNSWDVASGPDIFPKIYLDNSIIWTASTYYQNASSAYNYEWNCNVSLTQPTSRYAIDLYDFDDGSANDWMGGILFTPYYNNTNGFPNILHLDAGGSVAFDVYVTYSW